MSSMFENQASTGAIALVENLSDQLALLPDVDQDFVLGCKMHLEVGGILNDDNHRRLKRVARALQKRDTDTDAYAAAQRYDAGTLAVSSLSGALTRIQMLRDLASVIDRLNPQERAFANALAQKYKNKQAFTDKETKILVQLHASKGF